MLVNAVPPGPSTRELWLGARRPGRPAARANGISREEALRRSRAKVPIGRYGEPAEIADVVVFLCSARASNVTGAAWSVDGGTVATIV